VTGDTNPSAKSAATSAWVALERVAIAPASRGLHDHDIVPDQGEAAHLSRERGGLDPALAAAHSEAVGRSGKPPHTP
jgi:hypothetical protein